jgi:hypothetical protein
MPVSTMTGRHDDLHARERRVDNAADTGALLELHRGRHRIANTGTAFTACAADPRDGTVSLDNVHPRSQGKPQGCIEPVVSMGPMRR